MLKNLVNLSILTTVVVAVWLFVSIFNSSTSTTVSPELANQIIPIPATFNMQALDQLEKRTFIPTDLSEVIQTASGSASSVPTPILTPTTIPTTTPNIPGFGEAVEGDISSGSGFLTP